MKYIVAILAISALIICCNTGAKKSGLLSKPDDLKADEYVINIDRDTTVETKNGALLKIPRGSLTTSQGNTVTLEIKEAYSLQQMIMAGLTTQSDGEPLSSGGMIYINAKGGQDVRITQAIKVAIPADYLSDNMQLFKGEKNADGNIDWKEPTSLPKNKQLASVNGGQVLFQSKCANCHAIGQDMTGPNLAHFMKRFPIGNEGDGRYYDHAFYQYRGEAVLKADSINIPDGDYLNTYYHFDPYFIYKCNLRNMYGSMGPVLWTDTSDDNLLSIYRYIQNESDRKNLLLPSHAYLKDCADSCVKFKQTVADIKNKKEAAKLKRKSLVDENGPLVDKKPDSTWGVTNTPPPDFDERVSPKYYDAVYYQFTIESFGWYNIDVLMKNVNGVEESELFVKIVGQYREKIKIFLIIPSVKVYGEGGPAESDPDKFAFFYKNGKLPLPQNTDAYILAVTETEESIAFGIKKFTTSIRQELEMSLNQSNKELFTAAIKQLNLNRLHIKVADSKNADEIRKTDTDLKNIDQELKKAEDLKPKNCDCDCGSERAATVTSNSINNRKK